MILITFAQAPQTGNDADSSSCCENPTTYPNVPAGAASGTGTTPTTTSNHADHNHADHDHAGTSTTTTTTSTTGTTTDPVRPARCHLVLLDLRHDRLRHDHLDDDHADDDVDNPHLDDDHADHDVHDPHLDDDHADHDDDHPHLDHNDDDTTPTTTAPSTTTTTTTPCTVPAGGQVGLLAISQYITPGSGDYLDSFNHFSLLGSIEQLFGLKRLGYAAAGQLPLFGSSFYSNYTPA